FCVILWCDHLHHMTTSQLKEVIDMGNPVIWFEINGKDPTRLHDFYREVFGWTIDADNPMSYGFVQTGSDEGIQGRWPPARGAAASRSTWARMTCRALWTGRWRPELRSSCLSAAFLAWWSSLSSATRRATGSGYPRICGIPTTRREQCRR